MKGGTSKWREMGQERKREKKRSRGNKSERTERMKAKIKR